MSNALYRVPHSVVSWACPLMLLKSEIMLPHYAAPLCCHYADYAAIMPIMPPFNFFN
jgi:hypothetical protein